MRQRHSVLRGCTRLSRLLGREAARLLTGPLISPWVLRLRGPTRLARGLRLRRALRGLFPHVGAPIEVNALLDHQGAAMKITFNFGTARQVHPLLRSDHT